LYFLWSEPRGPDRLEHFLFLLAGSTHSETAKIPAKSRGLKPVAGNTETGIARAGGGVMNADLPIVLLLLVIGCAAFLFGIFYAFCRIIGAFFDGVVSLFRPKRLRMPDVCFVMRDEQVLCPRSKCGKLERRGALYCSQCGVRLTGTHRVFQKRQHGR